MAAADVTAARRQTAHALAGKVTRRLAKRSAAESRGSEARELSAFAACVLQAYNSDAAIAC